MRQILSILVFFALLHTGQATAVPITAPSWLVADGNGKIIQGENTKDVRSIASISKLMTAMIVLDAKQDLDEYIKPYTRRELLQLAIVHSDNKATEMLCNNYPGGRTECIRALNTKSKLTKLERYGISSYNNSKQSASKNKNKSVEEKNIINEKRRKTNLELHEVANCFFKAGVKEKSAASNSKGKEVVLPSGKIVRLRGYEDLVISILLKSYNEDQLVIDDMLQQYQIPIFSYVNVNQHTAHYYPDIYIPSENKIIEVKSRWWWDGNGNPKHSSRLENNLRKRKAVIAKGYNYELWLYQDKKNYKILNDSNF